ncbi:MAG: hypothetical protein Kow0037_27880 [Calditrichia bacterium]
MDILKASLDWARAEVFSSVFFILAGILFLLVSFGFWQLGKTELARAYIIPFLVTGALLLTVGVGLFYSNKTRLTNFPKEYQQNAEVFVQSEIQRAEKTITEFQTVVFKVIPGIIIVCALLVVFVNKPLWRASSIAIIAMMTIILLIDSNSHARMEAYHKKLMLIERQD